MTSNKNYGKRLLQAAVLGAFALAPIVGNSVTARADSPSWGQRDKSHSDYRKDDHKRDRHDNDRHDNDHHDRDHHDRDHHDNDHRWDNNHHWDKDKRYDHRNNDHHWNDNNRYDNRYNGRYDGRYNGGYGNDRYDGEFDFSGVVVDRDKKSNTVRVRGNNGRTYTVHSGEADHLDRGDRVRVRGHVRNGVVYAEDIDRR
jgi:hypothetical protein